MSNPRTHGQCPTCKHYGSDCHCHERSQHTSGRWTPEQQKLWHDAAVGAFYREQAAASPPVVLHWEQQTLETKLHYQAKAKKELRAAITTPDLLAALYDCVAELQEELDRDPDATLIAAAIEKAEAAIAKAEGAQ